MKLFVKNRYFRRAFTMVELLVALATISIVLTAAFEILGNVGKHSNRVTSFVDTNKDIYYAVEKLTKLIKEGGKLDYEQYFNARTTCASQFLTAGHYPAITGYGNYGFGGAVATGSWTQNFGSGSYACVSANGATLANYYATFPAGDGQCGFSGAYTSTQRQESACGMPQRYGQFKLTALDYNGNANEDGGDEDGDGRFVGDEDDRDLGLGTMMLFMNQGTRELYLQKTFPRYERTFFRFSVKKDPFLSGATWTCDLATGSGNACLGNVQVLKLIGKDLGANHDGTGPGAGDGKIDTWTCSDGFNCGLTWSGQSLPTGSDTEWVDIFPDYVSVRALSFYAYPTTDMRTSWARTTEVANPYVRIRMSIGLSGKQKLYQSKTTTDQDTDITTTINLSDF